MQKGEVWFGCKCPRCSGECTFGLDDATDIDTGERTGEEEVTLECTNCHLKLEWIAANSADHVTVSFPATGNIDPLAPLE